MTPIAKLALFLLQEQPLATDKKIKKEQITTIIFKLKGDGTNYLKDLKVGDEVKVYVVKVEETGKGPKVFVSRTNVGIVKRLFETYIPEVSDGTIEIVNIARDAGSRTKIGIRTDDVNLEPKGACVGLQGTRIKQIN